MTFSQLQTELDNRISAAKVTGFWSDDAKKEWLNQAGQRVCDFKPWEWLKKAVYIDTRDDREYYDYPEASPQTDQDSLKLNSIYNIVIEDEEYNDDDGRIRKTWDEIQRAKHKELDVLWFANHNKWFFLYTVPDNGKEMILYGLRRWRKLSDDADEPISPDEYDEAIVKIALATCLRKAKRYDEANVEMTEVLNPEGGMLVNLWTQEQDKGPRGYGGEMGHRRFQ